MKKRLTFISRLSGIFFLNNCIAKYIRRSLYNFSDTATNNEKTIIKQAIKEAQNYFRVVLCFIFL